ncbi:putative Helix-turn-helix protein [Vibrio chagasii]|nr:putative Helix-turn-helix protein [Vibrio chagasii]CAH6962324.1 putative Helix-turn-helix protein [Vibrio chagasii]CAH7073266.1 putative Helix-turn-helix protein [Vibrio chagasii]CAH7305925.1 putative Helix-turn-helix protein [Vibrio chagasii]CAH7443891.1 putative Helix-turn-helix protein [Vibrio chagasii]
MELTTFGQRLKYARVNHANISQGELAELAQVSQSMISALEKDTRTNSSNAVELADALGISVRWLMTGGGVMVIPTSEGDFDKLKLAIAKFALTPDEVEEVEEQAIKIAQEIFFKK